MLIANSKLGWKRIVGIQKNRANPKVESLSIENYYRINSLIPYVENFIQELKNRFINHRFEGK